MTPVATHTESELVLTIRRPATDPQTRARRERIASVFPWFLLFAAWLLLFMIQNRIDAPAHPSEEQTSADLAQAAQAGSGLSRVAVITLGFIGVVLLIRNRARIRFNGPILAILLLFLGWSAMSALWADEPALTSRRLISLALMVLFAAGCAARMNADTLTAFMAAVPTLNLLPGVIAEIAYGSFQPFSSAHRFAGTAPHPNVQAATLSVACILLCWLAWRARGSTRAGFVAALAVVAAFLIMTESRTSMFAVLAALAFSLILVMARDHKRLLPVFLAAAFLLLGLSGLLKLALSGTGEDHFTQAIKRQGDESDASTLNGRLDLWRQCLKFAAQRPLIGYGYGGFWSARRIEVISADQTWPIQQSHSAYIEQLLALGAVGLTLYVALLLSCLWVCGALFFQHRDAYGAWAAVLVFIAMHNVTEAINVTPLFPNLAFNLMVIYLAIIKAGKCGTNQAQHLLQPV